MTDNNLNEDIRKRVGSKTVIIDRRVGKVKAEKSEEEKEFLEFRKTMDTGKKEGPRATLGEKQSERQKDEGKCICKLLNIDQTNWSKIGLIMSLISFIIFFFIIDKVRVFYIFSLKRD